MNPTTEPKVWEGHKSKVVWSVWLFSVTGLLLHYFPLHYDFQLPHWSNSRSSYSAPTIPRPSYEAPKPAAQAIPWDVLTALESDQQIHFDGGVTVVSLDIPVGRWSTQVVTPESSKHYLFDLKPDDTVFYVKFSDGAVFKMGGDGNRFLDMGCHRGIMRFLGTIQGQRATVAISDQPFNVAKEDKNTIRLELDEVKWSDWVTVPPGYQFRISRPGCWADILFWDGRQVHLGPDDHVWFKDLSDGNFKIRGTKGPTEVFIEPRQ